MIVEEKNRYRLRRLVAASAPLPEPVRRYFRPGVNWAGRALYGVPVFGFSLIATSNGAFSSGDGFVVAQDPLPGAPLDAVSICRLTLDRSPASAAGRAQP